MMARRFLFVSLAMLGLLGSAACNDQTQSAQATGPGVKTSAGARPGAPVAPAPGTPIDPLTGKPVIAASSGQAITVTVADGGKIMVNGKAVEPGKPNAIGEGASGTITVNGKTIAIGEGQARTVNVGGKAIVVGEGKEGDEEGDDEEDDEGPGAMAPKENEGWLGVLLEPVPAALKAQLNIDGLMVSNVAKDSPADKAGIAQYDVILPPGDPKAKPNAEALTKMVRGHKPGDKLTLTVVHASKEKQAQVTLVKFPGKVQYKYEGAEREGGGLRIVPGLKMLPGETMPGMKVLPESMLREGQHERMLKFQPGQPMKFGSGSVTINEGREIRLMPGQPMPGQPGVWRAPERPNQGVLRELNELQQEAAMRAELLELMGSKDPKAAAEAREKWKLMEAREAARKPEGREGREGREEREGAEGMTVIWGGGFQPPAPGITGAQPPRGFGRGHFGGGMMGGPMRGGWGRQNFGPGQMGWQMQGGFGRHGFGHGMMDGMRPGFGPHRFGQGMMGPMRPGMGPQPFKPGQPMLGGPGERPQAMLKPGSPMPLMPTDPEMAPAIVRVMPAMREPAGRTQFTVTESGAVTAHVTRGQTELTITFKNADDLKEKAPKLFDEYHRIMTELR